jgi:hypothetical protein
MHLNDVYVTLIIVIHVFENLDIQNILLPNLVMMLIYDLAGVPCFFLSVPFMQLRFYVFILYLRCT